MMTRERHGHGAWDMIGSSDVDLIRRLFYPETRRKGVRCPMTYIAGKEADRVLFGLRN
jgi:hypothetical protein